MMVSKDLHKTDRATVASGLAGNPLAECRMWEVIIENWDFLYEEMIVDPEILRDFVQSALSKTDYKEEAIDN